MLSPGAAKLLRGFERGDERLVAEAEAAGAQAEAEARAKRQPAWLLGAGIRKLQADAEAAAAARERERLGALGRGYEAAREAAGTQAALNEAATPLETDPRKQRFARLLNILRARQHAAPATPTTTPSR